MTNTPAAQDVDGDLRTVPKSDRNGILEVLSSRRDPFKTAAENRRKYGDMVSVNALGTRMITASGPAAANEILMNKEKAFANEPAWSFLIGPFFSRGVLLMDFDEHRHHRSILQAAFTPKTLKGYMDGMQQMIADRMTEFPVGEVRMFTELKQLTLDIALEVFLGMKLPKAEADRINKAFIDTVRAGTTVVRKPVPGGRWWKGLRGRRVLEEFFYEHIPAKRAGDTNDLFSVLCHVENDDGDRFTDEDVVNHMIFVLMAAHDTTTITMTQMVYHLAKNPAWQQRAREQSLALDATLTYDDLATMTVIDLVMRESLRLCPPVPALPRTAIRDTQLQGYRIPKGTMVVVPQLANHRDPDIYSNPNDFDPERFSPERAEDKAHRMAWMPFGGGVHKCIGLYFAQMEIKTIMHHLLRNYELTVPADYVIPMDYSALPVAKDNLPVTVRRR